MHGFYRQTLYDRVDDFLNDCHMNKFKKLITPNKMLKTCKPCPGNCTDCIFNEMNPSKPLCFACANGYQLDHNDECVPKDIPYCPDGKIYNETTGQCEG